MKNLLFVFLACLCMACFRAPHLSPLPDPHAAAAPENKATEVTGHGPAAYASSDAVAAAGSAPAQPGQSLENAPAATYPVLDRGPATGAKAAGQEAPTRREIRKAVRKALLSSRRPAGTSDDPVAIPKRNGLALAALLTGIGGLALFLLGIVASAGTAGFSGLLFLLALITGILAVVFGAVAKGQIRNGKGTQADRGRATAGFILGLVNLGIFALIFLLIIALVAAWGNQ